MNPAAHARSLGTLAALLIALAIHSTPASAQTEFAQRPINEAIPSVIQVYVLDAEGNAIDACSGFIVESEGAFAVTSYSIIRPGRRFEAALDGGERLATAVVWHVEPDLDLALLQLRDPATRLPIEGLTAVELVDRPVSRNTRVFALGYTLAGGHFVASPGIVFDARGPADLPGRVTNALKRHFGARADWLQTNAEITHDLAGGPLLSAAGVVVGVSSDANLGVRHARHGLANFALNANHIDRFVRSRRHVPLQTDPASIDLTDLPLPLHRVELPALESPKLRDQTRRLRTAIDNIRDGREAVQGALARGLNTLISLAGSHDPASPPIGPASITDELEALLKELNRASDEPLHNTAAARLAETGRLAPGTVVLVTGNMVVLPGDLRAVLAPDGTGYLFHKVNFGTDEPTGAVIAAGRYAGTVTPYEQPVHVVQDAFVIHFGKLDESLAKPRWSN